MLAVLGLAMLAACSTPDGEPQPNTEPVAPSQVVDLGTLYTQNCAACHGAQGRGGASIALANPVYLAIVDEKVVHNVVANGVRGTSMPAFAQSAGGMLTDQQIEVITSGIFSRWGSNHVLDGANPPSYAAKADGNINRGQLVFGTYCASCHGSEGGGTRKGSAITNDSFLSLVSDQGLRTTVITGRPELGAPDWRGNVPGRPMTDQEITDVVAWLAARRAQNPGQPYSALNYAQHSEK
jgi:cytochrome c oxidase cbb3-type subunit 3/ubiquinol-cytochrome c reductase cytochrome c subunit